jgi:hypothetical protein
VTGTQAWPNQVLEPIYQWGNTPGTGVSNYWQNYPGGSGANCPGGVCGADGSAAENRDYYLKLPNLNNPAVFTGSVGMGCGPSTTTTVNGCPSNAVARPTTCTPGVGYFNVTSIPGTLQICGGGNSWSNYYTPYTYPHPLTTGSTNVAPIITIAPNPITFGSVPIGSSSNLTITVSNIGTAPQNLPSPYYSIGGANAVEFSVAGGTCTNNGTIGFAAGNNTCTVVLKFAPTATGAASATLTILGTATATANVTGTGGSAGSIPSVPTGLSTSVAGPNVTLSYTASSGTTPITYNCFIGTASVGPFTPFASVSGTSCVDNNLGNGTYWFTVSATNSLGSSAQAPAVTAVVATAPSANFNPSSLNFSLTPIGTTSASQQITLTNVGTAPLIITSVSISGSNAADFSQNGNCSGTLPVSSTCDIQVTFTPSTVGVTEVASLVLVSNDPAGGGIDTVALSGIGVGAANVTCGTQNPCVSLNFGNQFISKTSATQTVTFINQSGATITFGTIALTSGTQFAISGSSTCASLGTITTGNTCTVIVSFTPTSAGAKTDTLTIPFTGAGGTQFVIAISGTGRKHGVLKVGAAVDYPGGGVVIQTVLRPWNRQEDWTNLI